MNSIPNFGYCFKTRYPFHGTPNRAILLIAAEAVDVLAALGLAVFYGALGENIPTRGLDRRALRIGQRFRVGEAGIELTQVRLPCDTLNVYGAGIRAAIYDARARSGTDWSLWGMSGSHVSVIHPGILRPGDSIRLLDDPLRRGPAST